MLWREIANKLGDAFALPGIEFFVAAEIIEHRAGVGSEQFLAHLAHHAEFVTRFVDQRRKYMAAALGLLAEEIAARQITHDGEDGGVGQGSSAGGPVHMVEHRMDRRGSMLPQKVHDP